MRTHRSAFTLVELLVVVSIIALLLAILLPSLNKARDQAKRISCLSNQRQIGLAFSSYLTEENGGVFCGRYQIINPATPSSGYWYELIFRQSQSKVAGLPLWCPSDTVNKRKASPGGAIGYGYNSKCLGGVTATDNYAKFWDPQKNLQPPARLEKIARPAETILTTDSTINSNTQGWFSIFAYPDVANGVAYPRHNNECNVVFIDGHGEAFASPDGTYMGLYWDNVLGDIRHTTMSNLWDRN